jgi:hypothetical protein
MTPLDPKNQDFYNWLLSFIAFVQSAYGSTLIPSWARVATPGVDSINPDEVDAFYVTSPTLQRSMYIGETDRDVFGSNLPGLAAIVMASLAWPNPAPQPHPAVPVRPVAPPAPKNPVGLPFYNYADQEQNWTDLDPDKTTLPLGAVITGPDGRLYQKHGNPSPWGLQTWFALAPPAAAAVIEAPKTAATFL